MQNQTGFLKLSNPVLELNRQFLNIKFESQNYMVYSIIYTFPTVTISCSHVHKTDLDHNPPPTQPNSKIGIKQVTSEKENVSDGLRYFKHLISALYLLSFRLTISLDMTTICM